MNNQLIPAYDWELINGEKMQEPEREKYIKKSTDATGLKEVRKYLKDYLRKNNCTKEVKDFLELYLNNIALLSKTQIVWDGSYRNCVILIQPDLIRVTHDGNYYSIKPGYTLYELLNYFLNHAETIFLNVHITTHAEDIEEMRFYDLEDYYDDYYDYD